MSSDNSGIPLMKRSAVFFLLVIALNGLFVSGCTHRSLRPARNQLAGLPAAIAADYTYTKSPATAVVQVSEEEAQYVLKRVRLPVAEDASPTNRWVELDFYQATTQGRAPVILVLPMSGGGYSIERHFASYFASRGYSAAIVHRDKIPKAEQLIENLNPMMKRMVLDHKRVIDWLETQPRVAAQKIGIFGISLGGIKGAILTPLESRIQAAVLGLAGGDLPHILVHSTEPGLAKRRDAYLKEHHLTPEQAEAKLREMITRDPLAYAPYVDSKKVMLVIARFDTVVPTDKGLLLKEKMGNPETIMLPTGHYTAVLSIPYIKSQAFSFFEKRFADSAGPAINARSSFTRTQAGKR